MKKSGPDRKYTQEFCLAAVKQVIDGGRSTPQVRVGTLSSGGSLKYEATSVSIQKLN